MATRTLIRWSGLALMLAGVIQASTAFLHPDYTAPGAVFSPLWGLVGLAAAFSYLLMVFGLIGLHLRQAERAGGLGLIGFILALLDTALLVGIHIDKTFFLPYVIQQTPALQTMGDFIAGPPAVLKGYPPIIVLSLVLYLVGYILTGLAIMRADVLPRWAGLLLVIGTAMSLGMLMRLFIVDVAGVVLFGIAIAWLGFGLWSEKSAMVFQPESAGESAQGS
jgi:hypothetical protein